MAEKALKGIHGDAAMLEAVASYPGRANSDQRFWHNRDAKFFWDTHATTGAKIAFRDVDRAVYFTAFTGTQQHLHDARVLIRQAGFEPQVSLELKDSAKQRANRLANDAVLIKAKGVDIGLAVRMLEDASYGNFQVCLLFTSDIDYLPVIRAVRRMGKTVIVFGFRDAVADDSPFLYVPERFIDFSSHIQSTYAIKGP
jgi:uncharacterized LabA/DUF88 family protein